MSKEDVSDVAAELDALDATKKDAKPAKTSKVKASKKEKTVKAEKTVKKAEKKPKAEKTEKKPAKVEKTSSKKADKKPAKAAKASTEEKEVDENPAPKEIGGVWPFRRGSLLLFIFQTCLEGVSKKAFDAMFEKDGAAYVYYAQNFKGSALRERMEKSHRFMLARMRRGYAGRHSHRASWKFSEEGKHYRIYDVRNLIGKKGGKKDAKEKAA